MRGRSALVGLHRYVGLAMAGFLILAGLTGSLLAFKAELDRWLNADLFRMASTDRPALSPSALVERIETADRTIQVVSMLPASGDDRPVIVRVRLKETAAAARYDELFVHPATGAVLARRLSTALRIDKLHAMPFLYRLHASLHMPANWGNWILGSVAIAWLLDGFVGLYLTLPKGRPFWRKWRTSWRIKGAAEGYRRNLDLHRAFGLWFWAALLLVAFSSIALTLNRPVFRPVLSALLPTSPDIWSRSSPAGLPPMLIDWDAAAGIARAEAGRRGWNRPISILFAGRAQGFYMVRFGDTHEPGFGKSTLYVSGADGRILSVDEAGSGLAGDKVADLMFPIHTGQVAGLPGRILISAAGLVTALLAMTGVTIWWRKRAGRRALRTGAARGPVAPEVAHKRYGPAFKDRLLGAAATSLLYLLGAVCLIVVLTRSDSRPPVLPAMTVVDMKSATAAEPAKEESPAEPRRAGQTLPSQPQPKRIVAPPEVPAPALLQVPPAPEPSLPDAAPPATELPQESSPPRPSRPAAGIDTWEGRILTALNEKRRYPRAAMLRRQQGVPWIRFRMARDGRVLSAKLERSSGVPELDREAVALPRRAQPLPEAPAEKRGESFEFVVPVEFFVQ